VQANPHRRRRGSFRRFAEAHWPTRAAMTQKKRSGASSSCARPGRIGRVVANRPILDEMPHHVDPESVDPSPQPETQRLTHRRLHVRLSPIQIRLLGKIGVVSSIGRWPHPSPGAAAKVADPIIWGSAMWGRLPPDIPVTFWIGA